MEITIRTVGGMRFLKANDQLDDLVLGVLGRALALYEVRLYDDVVFGNHMQGLVGPCDALELARFTCFLHGNVAKEVGRLIGWRGRFWGRRYKPIPVVDEAALERRLKYIYEHGVKEGFVTSPVDWPGVATVKNRLSGEPLRGTWFDRSAEYEARRRGKIVDPCEFATVYDVPLSPAPCWEHLSEEEYTAKVRQVVDIIEEDAAEAARDGKRFLGLEWLAAQDRFEIPRKTKNSPAPRCHASTKASREAYLRGFFAFVAAYNEAADALVAGVVDAVFPEGSFPRPRPFVHAVESMAPS